VDDRRILSMVKKKPFTTSSQVKNTLQVVDISLSKSTTREDFTRANTEGSPEAATIQAWNPLSITEGICVWCKFRNYPFWPAVVKSVNRKLKKASIVFIDNLLYDQKKIRKGFSVALKTLKPFDCEETEELVCKAKEKYEAAIQWCLKLIKDYRIRVGCGFTGSFIEYFSNDISKFILIHCYKDEEKEEESHQQERRRKLLPDRSKAARNRANEKLVVFIVRQRQVEKHLQDVISGLQQSKWMRWFLTASRSVVDTYLEDDDQLDLVIKYLTGVYKTAPLIDPCLAEVDDVRFVLDVLLPEAIIRAIAGVDNLSLGAAEDKYLKGPCLSKREREEFDAMIEQQMKMKASVHQRPAHTT
uniref:Si:dkey-127k13.1 n=1 Tax=Esox lucius TaxID=8010 RepID=A0A3P8Y8Z1_ESOLU